jgi:hypothetical protein
MAGVQSVSSKYMFRVERARGTLRGPDQRIPNITELRVNTAGGEVLIPMEHVTEIPLMTRILAAPVRISAPSATATPRSRRGAWTNFAFDALLKLHRGGDAQCQRNGNAGLHRHQHQSVDIASTVFFARPHGNFWGGTSETCSATAPSAWMDAVAERR